jgi:putative alpha-1,2-mannosidase
VCSSDLSSDGYSGFIMAKDANGAWQTQDPKLANVFNPGPFKEGSSWTYSFMIPHDFAGLVENAGGSAAFADRAKHAFDNNLVDVFNEPGFVSAISAHYAAAPAVSSYCIRSNMANNYANGFPGNEDGGAMSSYYVCGAMGLFPNAGQPLYLITGPAFSKVTIQTEHGAVFTIEGENASDQNIYVQSCKLNGQDYDKNWIAHSAIYNGGTLSLVMGPSPSGWGTSPSSIPPSVSTNGIFLDTAYDFDDTRTMALKHAAEKIAKPRAIIGFANREAARVDAGQSVRYYAISGREIHPADLRRTQGVVIMRPMEPGMRR